MKRQAKLIQKKRFGKAIGNNAPSQLIQILEAKVKAMGGEVIKVSCKGASTQFYFTNETFTKHNLNERQVMLSNGNVHLRDGISAFNIKHRLDTSEKKYEKSSDNYDIKAMKDDYQLYIIAEQIEINRHNNNEKITVWSMGIDFDKKVC